MKTSDFFFDLPEHLIAQHPPEQRGQSRLMVLDRVTGRRTHRMVGDLSEILCGPQLRGKDGGLPLLVFNDSKVRKARLIGTALHTGTQVEFLLLEKVGNREQGLGNREQGTGTGGCCSEYDGTSGLYSGISNNGPCSLFPVPCSLIWKALVPRAKRRRSGSRYAFFDAEGGEIAQAEIIGEEGEFRILRFDRPIDDAWLDRYGHIPLPPYIRRQDVPSDSDRYQTVYAAATGSAAAPTAGLHFTRALLEHFTAAGIESAFLTLHVGLGTFMPVRSTRVEDHVMHRETFCIDEQTSARIETARAAGRKIIAVGTTSVRTLESAWDSEKLRVGEGGTSIFIYPGYQFKMVDALFTNFHTPESTLLMLAAAFAGRDLILESYAEAIGEGYRFFSYGDAMLIV